MRLEKQLQRWLEANLVDANLAARIERFEEEFRIRRRKWIYLAMAVFSLLIALFLAAWVFSSVTLDAWSELALFVAAFLFAFALALLAARKFMTQARLRVSMLLWLAGCCAFWANSVVSWDSMSWVLCLELGILILISVLVEKRRPLLSGLLCLAYLGIAGLVGALTPGRLGVGVLGLLPTLIFIFQGLWSWLRKVPFLKIFIAWLKKFLAAAFGDIKNLKKWLGPARFWAFVGFSGVLLFIQMVSRIPGFERFMENALSVERWILAGAVTNLLSLLPRERPYFSIAFSVPAWILIGLIVVRMDTQGLRYSVEGTHFSFGRFFVNLALIIGLSFFGKSFVQKKMTQFEAVALGPVGMVAAAILYTF